MSFLLKLIGVIWTLPNTLFGSLIGLVGVLAGGKMQFVGGAIEYHGGLIRWLFSKLPQKNIHAMTLGHTILGINAQSLQVAREHEHVHVRQYERWGPLFIPAYLLSSLYMKLKGKDPYFDNPFEVEAYAISSPSFDFPEDDNV